MEVGKVALVRFLISLVAVNELDRSFSALTTDLRLSYLRLHGHHQWVGGSRREVLLAFSGWIVPLISFS